MKDLEAKLTAAKGSCQKQQSRLMQITSIAEARATIKHLHSLVVNARVEEYER
uniref:Uncharacterized protein n=1 Tax=Ciona savignyi TaxID=51511 RepID=H2Z209_CIOSA